MKNLCHSAPVEMYFCRFCLCQFFQRLAENHGLRIYIILVRGFDQNSGSYYGSFSGNVDLLKYISRGAEWSFIVYRKECPQF